MPRAKALSVEQERRLVTDHATGIKVVELVELYGISKRTVYRILADYGVNRTIGNKKVKRKSGRAPARGRTLKPCGTNAAYARHKKNGEYPCTPCLEAHAKDFKDRKEAKK